MAAHNNTAPTLHIITMFEILSDLGHIIHRGNFGILTMFVIFGVSDPDYFIFFLPLRLSE